MQRNKLITGVILATIVAIGGASAATNIGTGSVVGSGGLTQSVVWNDTFPGTATGTINGLVVKARVQPTLSMTISGSGELDLGNLSSANYSTGTISIEIGTNASAGAIVTAKSTNGGLKNGGTDYINNLTVDGVADSYRFTSAIGGALDSTVGGFLQTANLSTEVNNSTTSHTLYTSTRPQALSGVDDFTFSISARPNAQTPAGNYSDIVQVSVVGSF